MIFWNQRLSKISVSKPWKYLSRENGVAKLDMKGEAKNFSAVALQSDVFAESKELKNPVISDIDLTLGGGVSFNFKSEVDTNSVLYGNSFGGGSGADNEENN